VRVFGEMVALLWNEGNARGAVRLEDLWNNLAKKIPFTLLCAYPLKTFSRETFGELLGLCAEHSELITGENETTDVDKEIAGTIGLIKRSLTDIKAKLAALNLQRSLQQ
jgi:MEDS: MEthanogen/methylotroph, DcmR Sensory domain